MVRLSHVAGRLRVQTAAIALFTVACSSLGPSTIPNDRFDYTAAIADSWKSQMLLNLVKIRYSDAPVFLDIGQIVAGYSMQGTLGATAGTNVYNGPNNGSVGAFGVAAGGSMNVSPTITYSPMTGERFARSLMTPIPPSVILNLMQAGSPVGEMFRTAVQSANGVDNRRVGREWVRRANPEFYVLLHDLERLQLSGDIGMRVEEANKESRLYLVLRPRIAAAEESALHDSAKILGLDPASREFRVVYGSVASNDKEIALVTRSIFEILTDIASYISVPEAHVADHRVRPTPDPELGPEGAVPPLLRVHCSARKPTDAFVAIPYLGFWFYIDSNDLSSKEMFSSIMFLFTFVETGSKEAAPILTIPTTR